MSEVNHSILQTLVDRKLSTYQIADELGISQTTVRYWLKKYGIKPAGRKPKRKKYCLFCGNVLLNNSSIYCSNTCQHEQAYTVYIEKWLNGKESGRRGKDGAVSKHIRKYLLIQCNKKCEICGLNKWNGDDIVLVMDHIDGNPMNNKRDNLRMLCSNCDAQLPTYKSRNRGNGRYSRVNRYREGKSY